MHDRAGIAHRFGVESEQDRQDETAAYDDLLDIQDLAGRMPQRLEECGRDTGAITPAEDGEECAVHAKSLTRVRRRRVGRLDRRSRRDLEGCHIGELTTGVDGEEHAQAKIGEWA